MKNIRAKRETSREYLMKLMYQTYISNGDITDLENELEGFLENNQEYIISRYKELVLTYSDRDVNLDDVTVNKCVDKAYLTKVCDILRLRIDDINELIENNTKNWSINRFSKIDLAILQIAIAEMLSDLNIPEKVSINQAIDLAKIYCEESRAPVFLLVFTFLLLLFPSFTFLSFTLLA